MLPALESTGFTLRKILSCFPQDLSLAFAYGSGVFRQTGTSPSQSQSNMVDFVFAVDDPVTWHGMNIRLNRSHYSFMKYFGPKKISGLQDNYGAGVYYNTLVPCDDKIIKYGVVSTETLIKDLLHWKSLYMAGRLHKPVRILAQNENERLQTALKSNLRSALAVAFLMLPESFSEEDLYLQVAGLSYFGDFRMIIGEDKSKVLNIVKPNMLHFRNLYKNILHDCPDVIYKQHQGKLEIDKSPEGQLTKLMSLPMNLQQQITTLIETPGKNRDVEEILLQIAQDPECGIVVKHGVCEIVKSSSLSQSAKGILTAGGLQSRVLDIQRNTASGRL
uniref:Phosphatidate cytidylyltransferase, mitochondrial n=1 Tax=Geotrypetes seraphini TaxID=260995 RepID=A0A6P8Q4W9_GEOSA|nr:phosphatidate cytidylyltransferase, mitochondrial isoform X2 [Geotrypetes seraphini]